MIDSPFGTVAVIDEHHLRVGDRVWWGEFNSHGTATTEYVQIISERLGHEFAFERRQFIVRFESKWSVSVIWGSMTYSDNHDHGFGYPPYPEFVETPERVEAAVFHADRGGIQGNDREPFAYIDVHQLNGLLTFISELATDAQFEVLQFDRE